jgi:hypothetical protein
MKLKHIESKFVTIDEQIQILEKALSSFLKDRGYMGLCFYLHKSILDYTYRNVDYGCLKLYIPLFDVGNAIKYAKAVSTEGYWWECSEKELRIKFLSWIIKELLKHSQKTAL